VKHDCSPSKIREVEDLTAAHTIFKVRQSRPPKSSIRIEEDPGLLPHPTKSHERTSIKFQRHSFHSEPIHKITDHSTREPISLYSQARKEQEKEQEKHQEVE
jgi:hypothetical protein